MTSFEDYNLGDDFLQPEGNHVRRDIEADLRELEEIITHAKQMPLSSSALVQREEVLAIIQDALNNLPEEIRQARWALRDREELMATEQQKAQQLMDQVRAEAARMVDKTEIVRQSRIQADKIISDAQATARKMINEAEDFIDGKLGGFEIVLDRLLRTVKSGRERMGAQGMPLSLAGEEPGPDEFFMPPPAQPALGEDSFEETYETRQSHFDQDSF
jgi:hypothetical protein